MKISLYAICKLRAEFWRQAAAECEQRIRRYADYRLVELKDAVPGKKTAAQIQDEESDFLLRAVPDKAFLVAMDKSGQKLSSESLAKFFEKKLLYGPKNIAFCIGGPLGFSREFLQSANADFSLSRMTFPHELARIILL